jgi:hypothetical protein
VLAVNEPASIQRRTLSSLTPRKAAASRILICGIERTIEQH